MKLSSRKKYRVVSGRRHKTTEARYFCSDILLSANCEATDEEESPFTSAWLERFRSRNSETPCIFSSKSSSLEI